MAQFSFRGKIRGYGRRLRRQIRLSTLAIWAERVAVCFWPLFTVVTLFLTTALLGWFEMGGPVVHRVLLTLFGLAALAAIGWGVWSFRKPERSEALKRLDQDVPERPLATMSDSLGVGRGTLASEVIWLAHQRRAEQAAMALKAKAPNLRLSSNDRWALRLFAPTLFLAALLGSDIDLRRAVVLASQPEPLTPSVPEIVRNPVVEAWAVPPSYTGIETVYLTARTGGEPVVLPEGTEITIRVTDLDTLPVLDAPGLAGVGGFAPLGGGLAEAVTLLSGSGPVRVMDGETEMAAWPIEVIPDTAPEIKFAGRPGTTATRALQIDFEARDDYGIVSAWGEIQPVEEDRGKGLELEPIEIALPLPITRDLREVTESTIEDLTEHPWAGAEVEIVLYAEDGAGQIGQTEPLKMRLPSRRFNDPLAASLVEQRRDLALDFDKGLRVLDVIQAVTRRPQVIFGDRHGPYLGTRLVIRRLANAVVQEQVPEAAPELVDLLWDIALSLEDGNLSDALERLRAAEQRLRDALENGTDEEVRQAMEEFRQAMNEYIQELARQMEQNPQAQQQQGQQQGQQLSQRDLEEMLNQMQQQAESGLRDQARNMLSELSRMLENLQAGRQQQQGSPGQQAMQELQEMIQRQRDLADRTFDELRQQRRQQGNQGQGQRNESGDPSQQGQRPGEGGRGQGENFGQGNEPGGQGQQGLAGDQEALRQALEELRRQLPGGEGASRALGEAGEAMGDARDSLQEGQNSQAVQDQMEALDRLSEGAQALAEQIQNGQGDVGAQGQGNRDGDDQELGETDPFDRSMGSNGADRGSNVKVPNQAQLDRAREILKQLRERSAEPHRPELELDYFDRLLDKF
ncbi:MAG: TIGR02302 family protein [Pseudomonadota bacterium]